MEVKISAKSAVPVVDRLNITILLILQNGRRERVPNNSDTLIFALLALLSAHLLELLGLFGRDLNRSAQTHGGIGVVCPLGHDKPRCG